MSSAFAVAGKNGQLTLQTRLATQGAGKGAGLGNLGGITLSGDGRHLFVINALSNTVSTFAIGRNRLTLQSSVDSGGLRPISVTGHEDVVSVLNANGAGNIAGFRNLQGVFTPLAGSSRPHKQGVNIFEAFVAAFKGAPLQPSFG